MNGRPLAGVRVADFGQFIAGPATGQMLADLGATVVKVEPLGGEAARAAGAMGAAMVAAHNRDKMSIAIDLKDQRGLEIGRRLLAVSDVVIENMRPGTMERLQLGPAQALACNPRIIYLSITGFGVGAASYRAGLDISAQAESGMMSVTGEATAAPQRVGFTVVDQATAYTSAMAVTAALYRRERDGVGEVIDTSLLEVAIHMQGAAWTQMFETGVEPIRKGNGYPSAAPAAEVIPVGGGHIVLSAYTPHHWARLCAALDRPEMEADPRFATSDDRVRHRAELHRFLAEALAERSPEEAVELLSRRGVVAGAIRNYREVEGGPDAARLNSFPRTAPGAAESYRYPAPPYRFRSEPQPTSRSAPTVGEHTVAVLADLGYRKDEINRLLDEKVVVG